MEFGFYLMLIVFVIFMFSLVAKGKNEEKRVTEEKRKEQRTQNELAQLALQEIEDAVIILNVQVSACQTGYIANYFNTENKKKSAPFGMGV